MRGVDGGCWAHVCLIPYKNVLPLPSLVPVKGSVERSSETKHLLDAKKRTQEAQEVHHLFFFSTLTSATSAEISMLLARYQTG
jgi:hypothetical protein